MKTRKEVLEGMHDAGLESLIDAELVLKIMTRRQLLAIKTDDSDKINALIVEQKRKVTQLEDNMKMLEEMIGDEERKGNKDGAEQESPKIIK